MSVDFLRYQLLVPRKHLEENCWEGMEEVIETEPKGERGAPRGPLLKPAHPKHIKLLLSLSPWFGLLSFLVVISFFMPENMRQPRDNTLANHCHTTTTMFHFLRSLIGDLRRPLLKVIHTCLKRKESNSDVAGTHPVLQGPLPIEGDNWPWPSMEGTQSVSTSMVFFCWTVW